MKVCIVTWALLAEEEIHVSIIEREDDAPVEDFSAAAWNLTPEATVETVVVIDNEVIDNFDSNCIDAVFVQGKEQGLTTVA